MYRAAKLALTTFGLLGASAGAIELTAESWDSAVSGKTVFVKFLAPWCGHCKRMKPDWDKLMVAYKDHATTLVADVDCTGGGKSLCETVGVEGFPTIKHGDPSDLEDYEGGRDFDALKKFADGLGPVCSTNNIDVCSPEKKKLLQDFEAMDAEKLGEYISTKEAEQKTINSDFEKFVEGLQKQYEEAEKKKGEDIKAIKDSGLGLAKSVLVSKKGKDEL